MRSTSLAVMGAFLLAVSACASEQPVGSEPGLARSGGDQRLLSIYRHDERRTTREVRIPAGTTRLRLRMDCVSDHHGMLEIRVGTVGAGAAACASRSVRSGFVALSAEDLGRAGEQAVTVRAPHGASWSVAVDAG